MRFRCMRLRSVHMFATRLCSLCLFCVELFVMRLKFFVEAVGILVARVWEHPIQVQSEQKSRRIAITTQVA